MSWITLARNHGIQSNAFFFATPVDLCVHNETVRTLGGNLVYHLPQDPLSHDHCSIRLPSLATQIGLTRSIHTTDESGATMNFPTISFIELIREFEVLQEI